MEIQKSEAVVYVDGYGREHDAVVTAVNPMNAGFVSLVYVDVNAPEAENVKKLADIPHVSNRSKQEANPDLPSYDVNCWKEQWEEHRALPADHPGFDHPFLQPKFDEAGARVPVERPQMAVEIEDHQKRMADVVDILTGAGQTAPPPQPQPRVSDGYDLDRVGSFLATRNIHFNDRAACAKFVDELKPHEMKGFTEDFGVWERANPAPRRAIADLEKAIDEGKPVEITPNGDVIFDGTKPTPGELKTLLDQGKGVAIVSDGTLQPQTSAPPVIETKQYTDGSSATGVAPLPDQSPAQQDAAQPSAAPPAEEGQSE